MMKKILITYLLLFSSFYLSAQCFENLVFRGLHTVGKKTDGTVWGWGYANAGQLLSTNIREPNPTQLTNTTDWSRIASGLHNTFVIKEDGTLWGFGSNVHGSLGINSNTESIYTIEQIGTDNDWVKVSSSSTHTLGLKSNGTLWAWGRNDSYQLGNTPATLNNLFPIQVGTDTDWVDIDAGTSLTSFAIKSDGTIWGWGSNPSSIIVQGSSTYSVSTPTQIGTDNDWVAMSLGGNHILAQKSDSTLWAWGGGAGLGVGGTPNVTNTPQKISNDKWIYFSAGGGGKSFGIKENGTLWAWGYNNHGVLGVGDTLDRLVPAQVGTDSDWKEVHAGSSFANMAVKTDGTVWYWGRNYYGEFGNGESYGTTFYLNPTQTVGICGDIDCSDLVATASLNDGVLSAQPLGFDYQWIDCSTNQPIAGANNSTFMPPTDVDGHYAVIITAGDCVDTSACVFVETVGIGELGFGDKAFSIHPNPAKDLAVVSYDLSSNHASLEVYDLLGRSLYKQNLITTKGELRLDISSFVSGVYIVVIREENGMVMQRRLVVE